MKILSRFTIILTLIIIISTNTYAEIINHENMLPLPGNQGSQGSCGAWAIAYAKTYYEVKEWNISPVHIFMSPSFIYNQLNGNKDEEICIEKGLDLLNIVGCLPNREFAYNPYDYLKLPNTSQTQRASLFKNKSYDKFCIDSDEGIERVKKLLQDNVLVACIPVYPDCKQLSWDNRIYDTKEGQLLGYHGIAVIGYNDDLKSFTFINSWRRNWGLNGYGYISYELTKKINPIFYQMIDDTCSPVEKTMSGLMKWEVKY